MSTQASRVPVASEHPHVQEGTPEVRQCLEHLEQQLRICTATLSFITDFAYTFDRDGRFLYANQPLLDLWALKLEDAVGKNFYDLRYPDELAALLQRQIQQVFDTGNKLSGETSYTSPSGVFGYYEYIFNPVIDDAGNVELVAGSTRDVTKRKQAEADLLKQEKLAAVSELAARLAHEINNPLQAVTNLITILKHSRGLSIEDQAFVTMAENQLGRVVRLTQQSLSFYRETASAATVNLEDLIERVIDLYGRQIAAKQITLTKRYLSGPTTIHSYSGEIQQVFSTLLVNAIEAVPTGGTIAIRIRKSVNRANRRLYGVRIAIADSGVGIPGHNMARIFEPFFTTKGENRTGLSLWVAKGIMNHLGGSIRMRSRANPGQRGTCFSIFLPSQLPSNLNSPLG